MNELKDTLEKMERLYNQKLQKQLSVTELNFYLEKITFIQNLRLVLFAHENMDKFIENMFRFDKRIE